MSDNNGSIIELGEAYSISSKLVEVRGFNFASITADIRKPHVIGKDIDDVRLVGGDGDGLNQEEPVQPWPLRSKRFFERKSMR